MGEETRLQRAITAVQPKSHASRGAQIVGVAFLGLFAVVIAHPLWHPDHTKAWSDWMVYTILAVGLVLAFPEQSKQLLALIPWSKGKSNGG